jgi:hypothetical protein
MKEKAEGTAVAVKGVPGVSVMLSDGREYVVPPLDLEQYESIIPSLPILKSEEPGAWVAPAVRIVALALSRNYPDMTELRLRSLLDLRTVIEGLAAALRSVGSAPMYSPAPPSMH